jgi:uncharacterized membrane protein YeaQ/YmgE (transglycosylase-associated protein family)
MLWVLIIGLFVGVVAKFLMPGNDRGGFIMTIVLGVAGAMLANWFGGNMGIYQQGEAAGFIAAVVGAMVILAVYRVLVSGKNN